MDRKEKRAHAISVPVKGSGRGPEYYEEVDSSKPGQEPPGSPLIEAGLLRYSTVTSREEGGRRVGHREDQNKSPSTSGKKVSERRRTPMMQEPKVKIFLWGSLFKSTDSK